MIILDTNVISDLMLPKPNKFVANWIAHQEPDSLYTTSFNIAEILGGLQSMPSGKRQSSMTLSFKVIYTSLLEDSVLNFDYESARYYALCNQLNRQHGLNISHPDVYIAAICKQYGAILATRNSKDFLHLGMILVNPWEEGERL